MFLKNKYYDWYRSLVDSRKLLARDGYTEAHHIVPASLGGSNNPENFVKLTAREHFVAHLLLVFCTQGIDRKKMLKAFTMMKAKSANQNRCDAVNSRLYEKLKQQANKARSEYRHSPEAIQAIQAYQKNRPKKPFTEEHKTKISESKKGKTPWNKGIFGSKASDETKKKMREAHKGRVSSMSVEQRSAVSERSKNYIPCFDKNLMKSVYILRSDFQSGKDRYLSYLSNEYKQLKENYETSDNLSTR